MDFTTFNWKEVKDTYVESNGKTFLARGMFDVNILERLKLALVKGVDIPSDYDFDTLVASLPEWKKAAITFLHYIPRSKLLPKATTAPEYHTMTPLFLWGMKEEYDIPYSSWKGTKLHFAFSRMMWEAIDYASNWSRSDLMKEIGDLQEARNQCLTYRSGKKQGQRDTITGWKCNSLPASKSVGELNRIPAMALRTILQLWLANGAYRKPGVMVLDLWDWDAVPELLDDVQPVDNTRIKRKVPIWEDL
jgi:hypothetical protein